MKFHRKALISDIPQLSKSTCPLGANQTFEGIIRLSICCQLCSFSADYGHLGQVIYVTKLICTHSDCSHSETWATACGIPAFTCTQWTHTEPEKDIKHLRVQKETVTHLTHFAVTTPLKHKEIKIRCFTKIWRNKVRLYLLQIEVIPFSLVRINTLAYF